MDIKNLILYKARQLFVKQGIKAITMDRIAGRLSISKRTIYINFENKHDLLVQCIKDKMVDQMTKDDRIIVSAPNHPVALIQFLEYNIEKVKSINPKYYSDLKKYYPGIWDSKIKEIDKYRRRRIIELLERGIEKGEFRRDIDIEVVALTLLHLFNSICSPDRFPAEKHSLKRVFLHAIINYIRGIVTKPGLELLKNYELTRKDMDEKF